MSDKRDDRINDRLDKMSEFYKHSENEVAEKSRIADQEKQKNDILNELPAEVRFQALQNGMSFEDLREFYAGVKANYYANKASYQGKAFNNERRQDNVRERVLEQEKKRQNEQERTRARRSRERQYVRF